MKTNQKTIETLELLTDTMSEKFDWETEKSMLNDTFDHSTFFKSVVSATVAILFGQGKSVAESTILAMYDECENWFSEVCLKHCM